ncbi:aminoglycoside phosphotransferase family protein [Candidatus Poribacteria bacterium]|jgi:aminoglycoside phosphotransferase (APT) family kinase protein|nr:aminoglycoside phosphotransferase family protein [Candidatus Poribacteria bacterium]MBT7808495.1 aminoglycoside phosphotransferase family protein [Candidatus Poribacteria bacterium]
MEQCLQAGVPVPRVLALETVQLADGEFCAMVQECAAGVPLSEAMREMSDRDWAGICRQAGAMLGRIHTVPVGGYYRLSPDGSWDFPTFEAIAESSLHARASERERLIGCGFSPAECEAMMGLLRESLQSSADETPVLCHGDFAPDHIFVGDDLTITAVIDFGEFQGGRPAVDFTQIAFWERPVDVSAFAAGYPDQRWFGPDRTEKWALGRLGYLMGYCAYLADAERPEERDYMCDRLRETVGPLMARPSPQQS